MNRFLQDVITSLCWEPIKGMTAREILDWHEGNSGQQRIRVFYLQASNGFANSEEMKFKIRRAVA